MFTIMWSKCACVYEMWPDEKEPFAALTQDALVAHCIVEEDSMGCEGMPHICPSVPAFLFARKVLQSGKQLQRRRRQQLGPRLRRKGAAKKYSLEIFSVADRL